MEARCEQCGWDDVTALTRSENSGPLCYECQCLAQGKATIEQHHHLGRAVDPVTIPIPGNVHRELSDTQRDWSASVRTNPHRDPLLWLAAALFGLRDHLAWWTGWIDRIAQWMSALSEALSARDGDRWWESMGLAPVWQEVTA